MASTKSRGVEIAANVTAALEEAERTPAWLSRKTGIKRTTLTYQIKHGYFPVDNLILIAAALGRELEDLTKRTAA